MFITKLTYLVNNYIHEFHELNQASHHEDV